jgi:S-methylmethionine-dependent homocysteine/selenocysteine methylase
MDFETCYNNSSVILMEGALGERLKREYGISFDKDVAMAGLIYEKEAQKALKTIWVEYCSIAEKYNLPFMATTPTRRANKKRVAQSCFNERIMKDNIDFLLQIKEESKTPMFIGGLMGCQGDAYKGTEVLSVQDAQNFHSWQADLFKEAGADFLFAGIMPAISEAIGMGKAMEKTNLPYIISFMIRKDGRLIDGTTLHDAIMQIDNATDRKPICYMTNCVHPKVLVAALSKTFNNTVLLKHRFHGIQANTSPLSPEELDNCEDLVSSDSISLAEDMIGLFHVFEPKIFGGCCGTDNTNMEEIAKRLVLSI